MAFIPTSNTVLYGQRLRGTLLQLRQAISQVQGLNAVVTGMSNAQREGEFGVDPADTANFVTALGNLDTQLANATLVQALDDLGGAA